MNLAYWILAGLLAAFYLYSGTVKMAWSRDRLRPMMAWVDSMPLPAVRLIGAVEALGALGLILPPLTGIASWPACAAAVGFVLLQIAASAVHLRMGDRRIAMNLVLLLVAGAVAWLA